MWVRGDRVDVVDGKHPKGVKRGRSRIKRRAPGQKTYTKYPWLALLEEWLRSDQSMLLLEFADLHRIPVATLRDKRLEVDGVPCHPFTVSYRKAHQRKAIANKTGIRAELEKIPPTDRHFVRALELGQKLTEHIMKTAADNFDAMSAKPFSYSSAGEAARVAMAAASTLRELSLDLQGIPAEDESYGWPLTKGFWPHAYQRDFIFDLPSTLNATGQSVYLFAFIGGIRSGKTRCGAEKFGHLCWVNRGMQAAIFGPTYRMLEDSTKAMFFKVLNEKSLSYKYRASDNSVTIFGDTRVLFRSMDNPEHLRGTEFSHFWIDEGGQLSDATAFRVIMGRMSEAKATEPCGIVTTTPNGLNWLYDECVTKKDENKVKIYYASTEQNISLLNEFTDRLKVLYDERFYAQEVQGKFIDIFAGQAYWNFDRTSSVTDEWEYNPRLPIKLCVDFNVDPMCWNIVQQFRFTDGRVIDVCIDELHVRTASTELTCREFLNRYGSHESGVHVHGDASGYSRSTNATKTDFQIIHDMLAQANVPGVEIMAGRHHPLITESVSAVNARLKNTLGVRSFYFRSNCTYTISDMERVSFVPGTREIDKSNPELTHHSDACRYYIYSVHPLRSPRVTMRTA